MSEIPEWAIDAFNRAYDNVRNDESMMESFCRELIAERKAATDRERERCANYIEKFCAHLIYEAMRFERTSTTPNWLNGNSDAENKAREVARYLADVIFASGLAKGE